jgi:flagella synthesis protein FlgN
MRLSSDQKNRLAALLAAELSETSRLQEILQREFKILGGNDPEQIGAISKEKLAQMQRTAHQLTERDDFLKELGLPIGKEGTDLLLQGLPRENGLVARWGKLQDLGKQLKTQNEINGNIVAVSQRQARQALDILSGKTGTPQTYGREGETRSTTQHNSLAKA